MTTPEQRSEWKRLAEAATPGPWAYDERFGRVDGRAESTDAVALVIAADRDGPFIASARMAVAALLAERESLVALLRECADQFVCPICGWEKPGHRPGCSLAAVLKEEP